MRGNSSAFTLVEVIIILLLLGIVSAAAIPSINSSLDEMKIDGAAGEVVYAIQYVQSLAVKEGLAYGVEFFPAADSFRCYDKATNGTLYHPLDKKPFVLDLTADSHLQGVDLASSNFAGDKVEFNSLGEPSESGAVVLGYAGHQKTVTVTAPTGKVSVQ